MHFHFPAVLKLMALHQSKLLSVVSEANCHVTRVCSISGQFAAKGDSGMLAHRPLKHGSVRGLGWSVRVKVPGIQISPAEAQRAEKVRKSNTVHTRCTSIRLTNVTTNPI
jgi:hypothetical protein